jgi:hypothetical protein
MPNAFALPQPSPPIYDPEEGQENFIMPFPKRPTVEQPFIESNHE